MNWISKQNAQRKANLLKYNPVVDHASDAPLHYPNKKMAKVEDKLTILGGDTAFPTDPDMSKPRNKRFSKKVEGWSNEKRDRKREKFQDLHQRQFEAFEYGQKIPNRMEGPLNKDRLSKTIGKAEDAYDEGNYKKAYRKGKSVARQAKRHGVMSSEEAKNFKQDMKSSLGMDMQGPLNNDKKKTKKASRRTRRILKKAAHDAAKSVMSVIKDNKSQGAGPLNKKNWIQEATASIKKRGTEGVCTGDKFGSASCPPGSKRYNLAKTFKKMAKNR